MSKHEKKIRVSNAGVPMQNFSCVTRATLGFRIIPETLLQRKKKLVCFIPFISLTRIVTDVAFVNM
jgi:hypothetical protein